MMEFTKQVALPVDNFDAAGGEKVFPRHGKLLPTSIIFLQVPVDVVKLMLCSLY